MHEISECMKRKHGGLWDNFEFVFYGGGKNMQSTALLTCTLGDLMASSNIQGQGGHFGRRGCNCTICEIDSIDLLRDVPAQARTLARLYHQSHMFPPNDATPFTCPGCGAKFTCPDDIKKDNGPANMQAYELAHAGSGWHRPPLLPIEPIKYVLCCLHMLLSLTKLLFKRCIIPMLLDDTRATICNSMLQQLGICIPKQKKVAVNAAVNQSQRIKFTGAECLKLLEHWDVIVDTLVLHSNGSNEVKEWAKMA